MNADRNEGSSHRPVKGDGRGARTCRALPLGLVGAVLGVGPGCSGPEVFEHAGRVQVLEFRTYEGSGEVVHPDVVRPPGRDLWMALTPYPGADEHYENPSVYRSRDGLRWEEPAPVVNPVVPRPHIDHNCDPDLVHDGRRFHLFYLETQRREYNAVVLHGTRRRVEGAVDRNFQQLRVVHSPDGRNWTEPETVIHWDLDDAPMYLSPCVVRARDRWRLYLVDPRAKSIVWASSADLSSFGEPQGTLDTGLEEVRPWHLDIFPVNEGWVALLCARGPDARSNIDTDLWLGASRDLERWRFRPDPILESSRDPLEVELVYRSTGHVENDVLAVWYSGRNRSGRWLVGVRTFDASVVRELLVSPGE